MNSKCVRRLFGSTSSRGLTLIELLIGVVLMLIVGSVAFKFYAAQHELYLAQTDVADRQGNLRFASDELSRVIRNAGYQVPGPGTARVSAGFDTLQVYRGSGPGSVDTLTYYIDRGLDTPTLVRKLNGNAPAALAHGIDSAAFVPAGAAGIDLISFMLVSTLQDQYENTALQTRRRVGKTVYLRNR